MKRLGLWKGEQTTRYTATRYNGLKNQGATCYLNSVLQCLYMTQEFREEVENFQPYRRNSDETSVVLMQELQKLFTKLKYTDGTTKGITQSLLIEDVYEQQDAVEYYQKILKAIGAQASRVFEGKMSDNTKCQNGHTFQENIAFLTIPISIKNKHRVFSVGEGLQDYLTSGKLDEDNWAYCEHCTQKNETKTWNKIEEFPAILTLHLKRFHSTYNILMKNDCSVCIPRELLIDDSGYELYAVINHMGGHHGGHYNAVIKPFDDDDWYCFDDLMATKVLKQCLEDSFQKSQNAYLLMYRKTCVSKLTNERFRVHQERSKTNGPLVKLTDQSKTLESSTSQAEAPVQDSFEKEEKNKTSLINKQELIKEIQENRDYIKSVAEVLRLTAKQSGHRVTMNSDNRENFLAVLEIIGNHNTAVKNKLTGAHESRYISHHIENNMLDILAEMVRSTIISEVKESQFFSLIADETKDANKKGQIALVLRYYYNGAVKESFLHFEPAEQCNAAELATKIIQVLERYGLQYTQNLVGHAYNGMSNKSDGIQHHIRAVAKQAIYFHSNYHCLNLILVDTIPEVECFFSLVTKLCMFMSESYVHTKWLNIQKQMYNETLGELPKQSDTRCTCQYKAWHTILNRFSSVICVLEEIDEEKNGDMSVEARGLLAQIDLQFIGMLFMLTKLFGKAQPLSEDLQSPNFDLAMNSAETLKKTLKDYRNETVFEKFWNQVLRIAELCSIDTDPAFKRNKMQKERLDIQIGGHSEKKKHTFCTGIFYPVIDSMLTEISSRFSKPNCEVMRGIQVLNPTNVAFCDEETLFPFASMYECNVEDLKHELHQLKTTLKREIKAGIESPSSIVGLIKFIEPYHKVFHELFRLCKIAVTIPVSTGACETSSSIVKHIKSYLKSTKYVDRLNTLGVLNVESERAKSLDLDKVVNKFALINRDCNIRLL